MGLEFHAEFDAHRAIQQLDAMGGNTRALMEAIGQLGESQTQRRIEVGGPGPGGEAWEPTKGKKKGKGTLRESGALLESIAAQPPAGNSVSWGSELIYAAVHQFGATIKPKTPGGRLFFQVGGKTAVAKEVTIPARPYLGISPSDAREIEDLGLKFISGDL